MGFNTRDREHDHWVRTRAREVRRLEDAGRALHLIVAGTKAFNDKSFVTRVLDRLHRERGIGVLLYAGATRTTYHADRWAQSRRVRWCGKKTAPESPCCGGRSRWQARSPMSAAAQVIVSA